jgi:hypothetical protein
MPTRCIARRLCLIDGRHRYSHRCRPVHGALRNVASDRHDELATCKKFVDTLRSKHILAKAGHDQEVATDLRATKQRADPSAALFCIANRTKSVAAVGNNRLNKSYQVSLQKIGQLRSQIENYSSTLALDVNVYVDERLALQESEARAEQARAERARAGLVKAEEHASRTAQAMQKMKLEPEVLRNAEHNDKHAQERNDKEYALEKATNEVITLRSAVDECQRSFNAHIASLSMALQTSQAQVANGQRKAEETQKRACGYHRPVRHC